MLWLACKIICCVLVFTEFCAEMVRAISAGGKESAHWSSAVCPDFQFLNPFPHFMNPLPPVSKIIFISYTFSCINLFFTFQIASSQLILYMVLHNSFFFHFEKKGDYWRYTKCPTKFLPDFTGLLIEIF